MSKKIEKLVLKRISRLNTIIMVSAAIPSEKANVFVSLTFATAKKRKGIFKKLLTTKNFF